MSIRGRAFSAPWLRFHDGGAADVYIIIRVRASGCGDSALNPPPSRPISRRRSAPAPAQQHALPEHFLTPFPRTSARPRSPNARPQAAPCIPRRPHNTFPVEDLLPPPHNDAPCPCPPATSPQPRRTPADLTTHSPLKTFARPRTATHPAPALLPHPTQPRCTPADLTIHSPPKAFVPPRTATRPSPQRRPASPSVPLRAQKNGTAQWMCDAECLGRPSLRSVIGVGEPRAVRRRCGALAWRVGLRPQPWALRSRRCGRVLRA